MHSADDCVLVLVENEGSLELKLEGCSSLVANDFDVAVGLGDGLVADVFSNASNRDGRLILVVVLVI